MHEIVTAKDNTMSSKNRRSSGSESILSSLKAGKSLSVAQAKKMRTALYIGMAFVAVLLVVWLFHDL